MNILRLVFLLTLFFVGPAHAIVSMESVHLGKTPEGYSGAFDINAIGEYGNTEKSSVSTGLKLVRKKDAITNFVLMNYQYGQSAGVRDKNKAFIHGRHIHQMTSKYAWEGFAQASSDEFTRLTLRLLVGGGARIGLWSQSDAMKGFFGLGGFYEKEKLDIESTAEEDDTKNAWRGNMYFVVKAQINEHVSVVSTTYYQPNLGYLDDFRAIEDASLVSNLTESLAAKISLDVSHDSKPVSGVKNTDTTLKVGLDVSF
ncbi:MAG: DUF481 domain-containing protein [Gammaproteobacteria bacterium]|jgi:putative salt-induced outer membrane protein YdiY